MKKVCIVGYGIVGRVHTDAVSYNDDAQLYAICDIDKQRADIGAQKYNVKAFYSFEQCINDPNVDVLHICTPHHLHCSMAEKALLSGKDVFLEKPVCLNENEFTKLIDAQKKSGKSVCVCFQNRTNDCVKKIQQELLHLGRIKAIYGTLMWFRDRAYYESGEWRGKWATEGGGLIINQAIHTIDLLGLFTGGFKSVDATLTTKCLGEFIEVEDTADVVFETECGARALFFGSNCYPINISNVIEINCKNGSLHYSKGTLILTKDGIDTVIAKDKELKSGKDYWGSGHYRLIKEFYKYLETGVGEIVSLNDVKNTMKTIFAIYESTKSNERKCIK